MAKRDSGAGSSPQVPGPQELAPRNQNSKKKSLIALVVFNCLYSLLGLDAAVLAWNTIRKTPSIFKVSELFSTEGLARSLTERLGNGQTLGPSVAKDSTSSSMVAKVEFAQFNPTSELQHMSNSRPALIAPCSSNADGARSSSADRLLPRTTGTQEGASGDSQGISSPVPPDHTHRRDPSSGSSTAGSLMETFIRNRRIKTM